MNNVVAKGHSSIQINVKSIVGSSCARFRE